MKTIRINGLVWNIQSDNNMSLDYYGIAGDLQTKAMQFSALASNTSSHYNKEEHALKYIDDLIYDLREYKKLIKKELLKKGKSEQR